MRYVDFSGIMSLTRVSRYLIACANDSRKAMILYRQNLQLSQELFTIIGCFEVALRNRIDSHYLASRGNDWLRDAAAPGGIFDKTVIDPNVLVASLSSQSKHYWLIEALLDRRIELYLNGELKRAYEKALKIGYSETAASNFLITLKVLPNVFHTPDPDYLISHDKNFTVSGPISFPKVDVVRLDEFLTVLN